MTINNNQQKPSNSLFNISKHALHYATEQHLPPFKITCQPGVKDHQEETVLIKALFAHIKNDFSKINQSYSRPLGFDTWYVDRQGALICFTRELELFVYLWDITHYPSQLINTSISPIPPSHLPSQHSVILKFVSNLIPFEDVLEEISNYCQSKTLLEEMKGTMSEKSRHIRLDISSKEETDRMLYGGVFSLHGQLIEVVEFLAPPRLFICSRCNCPGHVIKECKDPFDRCRRC